MANDNYTYSLSDCEQEPIHKLGFIQSYAGLIATDLNWNICFYSQNLFQYTSQSQIPLGQPLETLVTPSGFQKIKEYLQKASHRGQAIPCLNVDLFADKQPLNLTIHRNSQNKVIIEFEDSGDQSISANTLVDHISPQFHREKNEQSLLDAVSTHIQELTGFDRVMIYKFRDDLSGQVVSEVTTNSTEQFLGLCFPASDIPPQARRLYHQHTFRMIANTQDQRIALEPTLSPVDILDLSASHCRAVAPIHIEYLNNMNVSASFSLSLIIDDKLWGLIACHHMQPRLIPMLQRHQLVHLAQVISLELQAVLHQQYHQELHRSQTLLFNIISGLRQKGELIHLLKSHARLLMNLIPADGLGIVLNNEYQSESLTLNTTELPLFLEHLHTRVHTRPFSLTSLHQILDSKICSEIAGVYVIPLHEGSKNFLLFFRKPTNLIIQWAGHPKGAEKESNTAQHLTPRRSFEIWVEQTKGRCLPWTELNEFHGNALMQAIMEIVLRQSLEETKIAQNSIEKQTLLIAELNHRVRNILNLVNAIVTDSSRKVTIDSFIDSVSKRVMALSTAHNLLSSEYWQPVGIYSILDAELKAYSYFSDNIYIAGPNIEIRPEAITPFILTIHELITNAAKYGPLAANAPTGSIYISWTFTESGFYLDWAENNPEKAPFDPKTLDDQRSFGMELIFSAIPHELEGDISAKLNAQGIHVEIHISGEWFVATGSTIPSLTATLPLTAPAT